MTDAMMHPTNIHRHHAGVKIIAYLRENGPTRRSVITKALKIDNYSRQHLTKIFTTLAIAGHIESVRTQTTPPQRIYSIK